MDVFITIASLCGHSELNFASQAEQSSSVEIYVFTCDSVVFPREYGTSFWNGIRCHDEEFVSSSLALHLRHSTQGEPLEKLTTLIRSAIAVSALTFVSLAAHAASIVLKAELTATHEVPAKDSAGTGTLKATFNTETNELTYHIEFSDLTGPVSAAHFHGPAAEGANAKPQVFIKTSPIVSPIDGKATLTPEQAKDLLGGQWYFNLHTSANPGGEIRGQVLKSE